MLAVAGVGVAAVGDLVAFRREELGLPLLRPAEVRAVEMARLAGVEQAHLLQEHEVGVEGLDRQAEVVDLQPLARADAAHALVGVVGGHAQRTQAGVGSQQ